MTDQPPMPPSGPPTGPPIAPPPTTVIVQKQGGCLRWIGIACVVLIALVIVAALAGGGDDDRTNSDGVSKGAGTADASDDVELVECGVDEIGWGEATVKVTNNSSKRSDYFVTVAFESADGSERYAEGLAAVMALEPGQTSTEEASAVEEIPAGGKCRVTEVQRTAS